MLQMDWLLKPCGLGDRGNAVSTLRQTGKKKGLTRKDFFSSYWGYQIFWSKFLVLIILSVLFSHLPSGSLVHLPTLQASCSERRRSPSQNVKVWRLHCSCPIRADPCCRLLQPPQYPSAMRINTGQQVNRELRCKAQLLFIDQTPAINLNSSYLTWKLNKRLNAPLKQVILKQQFMYTDVFKAYFRML